MLTSKSCGCVVIDADGIPAKNFTEVCAGPELLGDPRVGATQVEVRMKNRDDEPPEKVRPQVRKCSASGP